MKILLVPHISKPREKLVFTLGQAVKKQEMRRRAEVWRIVSVAIQAQKKAAHQTASLFTENLLELFQFDLLSW